MMKMAGRVVWCCSALLLTLNSVSAIQRLYTIEDLKKIDFGSSVPKHSLVLLYWFAHTVSFDQNKDMWLTFNPRRGEYGSHNFNNYENLLANLPPGQQYFIIGNVDQNTSRPLPEYVVSPPFLSDRENRDRIIIRVNEGLIEQMYLTQHYGSANSGGAPWYDPNHTYEITTNLLRQIRQFSQRANVDTLQYLTYRYGSNANVINIRLTWEGLASLVLFFRIVTQTNLTFQLQSRRTENKNNNESWNRGSIYHYTQQPSDDNIFLLLLLPLLVILCVGAFFLMNVKLPRV